MADARLRSEWLGAMRFDDLSDTAWRVFTCGLMWSVEQGTDGFIPIRYMKFLHPDGPQSEAAIEIESAGLWELRADGAQYIDWDGALGQSTAEQVEAYKANARNRQRAWRERQRKKLEKTAGITGDAQPGTRDSETRDVTRYVGKGEGKGKGEGEQGKGFSNGNAKAKANTAVDAPWETSESVNAATGEITAWPVATIPQFDDEDDPGYCSGCGFPLDRCKHRKGCVAA